MAKLQKKQRKGFMRYKTHFVSRISTEKDEKLDGPEISTEHDEQLDVQPENEAGQPSSSIRKWYEELIEDSTEQVPLPQEKIDKLRVEAKKILSDEVMKHELKLSRTRSDFQWIHTVLAKGTTSDKIAVHTLLIQNSPLHSLLSLESLVNMARVAKKNECIMAIDTLTELFLSNLLPQDRKLRLFEACPLQDSTISNRSALLHYYFEDQLKASYRSFVDALNLASRDTVDANKERAIVAMYKLLSGCPEQEVLLLRNLVNKMGDPSAKIVSKVIYCLSQLLHTHPNMKAVVMDEIEKLIFRPNVNPRAQYYCICFLSQFVFTDSDTEVAKNLIKLYFSFFKACIKTGDVDSRMMSVLLMGVNRAYPFAKAEIQQISEHVETMYKVVNLATFNVSLHTLCLLYHVCDYASTMSDRFYSALYKKLADPGLRASCYQAMFLSLVFRALRKDTHAGRIRTFVKRLLQVCMYSPVPLACGILYMVSQLVFRRKDLLALSCKARFVDDCDDDEDEHYEDVKLEESVPIEDVSSTFTELETLGVKEEADDVNRVSWLHSKNMKKKGRMAGSAQYDAFLRNPMFAGAEHTAYVELLELSKHFHPSVALFASNILQGTLTKYSGDPLLDFTLVRFLERFVFKNPKKMPTEGLYIHPFNRKKNYVASGAKSLSVNSACYLNMEESNIPEDERFLYRYLYMKKSKTAKVEGDEDAESVASEEFEEMMDNLTGTKNKNLTLDFADHITAKSKDNKSGKHLKEAGSDDEESEEENESFSDADENEDSNDNASDMVFDSDDTGNEEDIAKELKDFQFGDEGLTPMSRKRKVKAKKNDLKSMFASADEFAEILQDEGASGHKGELLNKDNAGVKQLKWESARDFWVNRLDKKRRKKGPVVKGKKLRRK